MANLDWFRVFLAVADSESITRASENLYISQPAVTKCIKQLEQDLGAPLFVRKHNGVALSEYGKAIYDKAKFSVSTLESFESLISDVKNGAKGELKIATTTSNVGLLLAKPIEDFCKSHSSINLKIIRIKEEEIIAAIGEYDFIFTDLEFVPKIAEKIFEYDVNYQFIASGKNSIQKFEIPDLEKQSLVLINKTYTSRQNIDNYFHSLGIELAAKYEVDNYATAVQLVKNGLGIGIVNPDYFRNELNSGEIKILQSSFQISARHLSLIRAKQPSQSITAKTFEQILKSIY